MLGNFKKPIVAFDASPEIWKKVSELKKEFIKTGILPEPSEYLPAEVLSMWQDARNNGIIWDCEFSLPHIPCDEFAYITEDKELMISLFLEHIKDYSDILENTNFNMTLCDENGVMLTVPISYNKLKGWDYIINSPGDVWHENVVGVTSHTIAIRYNRPTHLMGPVNYLKALEGNIASAAPINNEYDDVVGCVIITQENANVSKVLEHNLGWVISTAHVISNQIKLLHRNKRLHLMNSSLTETFAASQDGYLLIDEEGNIVNMNSEAARQLFIKEKRGKINLQSLIENPFYLDQALKTGRSVKNQEMTVKSSPCKKVTFDIRPYHNRNTRYSKGAIIKITCHQEDFSPSDLDHDKKVSFDNIITKSPLIINLKNKAKTIAAKPINILLMGESGTGKELFAHALHNFYNPDAPFIAINCAAIPESLIESELFGYEKGAFTGADPNGKKGKIELADGGTLFLDEIGDMPIELQPVLLRVIEEQEVVRLGSNTPIPVNFRVISATNKPLTEFIEQNKFRSDLYFRLSMVNLEIPALRQRGNDVLLLADHFIRSTCNKFSLPPYIMSPETEELISRYCWPGNVRQLENAMVYAVTMAQKNEITPADLPEEMFDINYTKKCSKLDEIKNMQYELIRRTVDEVGNVKDAANYLGLSVSTVYRKLQCNKQAN